MGFGNRTAGETVSVSSLLAIYLQDHHAAAMAGARLAGRAASKIADGKTELATIAAEIEEDLHSLERVMEQLGVGRQRVKDGTAVVGERIARLKPNGRLSGRSPLSDLLELETLVVGITGKEALWRSLQSVPAVPTDEVERLIGRAVDQRRRVEALRMRAATRCLSESP